MKLLKFLLITPFFFWLVSCSKDHVKANAPKKVKQATVLAPKLSTFALPINIDLSVLSDTLNKVLEGALYTDDSYERDDLKVFLRKNGTIKLSAQGEYIVYEVPLHADLDARKKVVFTNLTAKTSCDVKVVFKTKLELSESWGLQTQTEAVNYDVLNNPVLDFGVVELPATGIINLILDNFLDAIAKQVDVELQQETEVRKYVQEFWDDLQTPILVDESYGTWVYMRPEHFFYTPITGNNEKIQFSIGVSAYADAVTGHKPDVVLDTVLPKVLRVEEEDLDFDIFLKTELYYFKMNEILQKDLKGYTYNYTKKKSITITEVEMSGNGNEIVLKVDFDGDLSGEVYMTGVPKYNPTTQELYVDDFEFDIQSKKALVKVADWLLSGSFKKQMNKYMRFSLKESINESLDYFQLYLKEHQLDSTVEINCNIKKVEMDDVVLEAFSLSTILEIVGEVELNYGR